MHNDARGSDAKKKTGRQVEECPEMMLTSDTLDNPYVCIIHARHRKCSKPMIDKQEVRNRLQIFFPESVCLQPMNGWVLS